MASNLPESGQSFIRSLRRKGIPQYGEEVVEAYIPATDFSFIAAVVALLALCPLTILGILIKNGVSGWHVGALPLFIAITYIALMYRARRRIALGPLATQSARDIRIQLVLLVIAGRLAPNLFDPSGFGDDIAGWLRNPYDLINLDFWLALLALLAAWSHGRYVGRLISKLYVQAGELYVNPRTEDRSSVDHIAAFRNLAGHWREGALLCLFLFIVTYLVTPKDRSDTTWALGLSVIYYLLGIPFLSWARLRLLRTGWQLGRVHEPGGLSSLWARSLLVVFAIAGSVSLLLPHTSTLELGGILTEFWGNFFRGQPLLPTPSFLQPMPNIPVQQVPTSTGTTGGGKPFPFWEIVGAIAFWSATIGIILYALSLLFSKETRGGKMLRFFLAPLVWLWRGLRNLWRLLFGRRPASEIGEAAEDSEIIADDGLAFQALAWLRREPPPTDPRGRVRYYYGRMLRRGARVGLPRAKGMTSGEYAAYLAERVPEAEAVHDAATLTAAFGEACYSSHSVSESTATEALSLWQRLKKRLRH